MMKSAIFLSAALSAAAPAWAVNKCTGLDGKITYQAAPCAPASTGEQIKLQPVPEASPDEVKFNSAASRGKVMVGMSAAQVRRAWGAPTKINSSVGTYGKHEQWVYDRGGYVSQYVYVQNGVVSSIQSPE